MLELASNFLYIFAYFLNFVFLPSRIEYMGKDKKEKKDKNKEKKDKESLPKKKNIDVSDLLKPVSAFPYFPFNAKISIMRTPIILLYRISFS